MLQLILYNQLEAEFDEALKSNHLFHIHLHVHLFGSMSLLFNAFGKSEIFCIARYVFYHYN